MADTVRVRATRNTVLQPGVELTKGTTVMVTALQAAILRDCNAIELVDPADAPLLRQAMIDEDRRVLREAARKPMPSLDGPGWIPRF